MKSQTKKSSHNRLLAAIFSEGKKAGLEQEFIRKEVAFAVIHKRLSKASNFELVRVLEHITGNREPVTVNRKYPSSRAGLILELEDLARSRWGIDFEKSLNRFINSRRRLKGKSITHYRFLNVAGLKAFKKRLKEMRKTNMINPKNHQDQC